MNGGPNDDVSDRAGYQARPGERGHLGHLVAYPAAHGKGQAMKSGAFSIQLVSVFPAGQRAFYDTGERAFAAASRLVNARTFSDMKTRFSGPQRYAMGHQKCPYAMYGKLCNSPAGVGTVWCPGHPNGRTADV